MANAKNGFVLIGVLWITLALSLILTGFLQSVRDEVKLVSVSKNKIMAKSLGMGVINIALQDIVASPEKAAKYSVININYHDALSDIVVQPITGLVNVNLAPMPLLNSLFMNLGGVNEKKANSLTNSIIAARSRIDKYGGQVGFNSIEDLLSINGMDYDVYSKIVDVICAERMGTGLVNVMAAPNRLLIVLTDGDEQKAAKFQNLRQSDPVGIDMTGLNPNYLDGTSAFKVRLEAYISLDDKSIFRVSRSFNLFLGKGAGLPWVVESNGRIKRLAHKNEN